MKRTLTRDYLNRTPILFLSTPKGNSFRRAIWAPCDVEANVARFVGAIHRTYGRGLIKDRIYHVNGVSKDRDHRSRLLSDDEVAVCRGGRVERREGSQGEQCVRGLGGSLSAT